MNEVINKFVKVPVVEYSNNVTNNVTVSICIQTYQHVNYIKDCLEGILMQKANFNFEILLGEDSSTDGTREICIDYAQKYSEKIRLFLHDRKNNILINGSPSGRFNFLNNLFSARGKYIAICEGDDYWTDPYKLQKQYDLMEGHPEASMCVALSGTIDQHANKYSSDKMIENEKYKLLSFDNIKQYYHTSTYLIRTKIIKEIFQTKFELFSGDTSLRYLLLEYGPFVLLNEEVSVYRQTGTGVWTSLKKTEKLEQNYIFYNKFRNYHQHGNELYYAKKERGYLRSLINEISIQKDKKGLYGFKYKYFLLNYKYDKLFFLRNLYSRIKKILKKL